MRILREYQDRNMESTSIVVICEISQYYHYFITISTLIYCVNHRSDMESCIPITEYLSAVTLNEANNTFGAPYLFPAFREARRVLKASFISQCPC